MKHLGVKLFKIVKNNRVHLRELFRNLPHSKEHFLYRINSMNPAMAAILVGSLFFFLHYRVNQLFLVGEILIDCLFAYSKERSDVVH